MKIDTVSVPIAPPAMPAPAVPPYPPADVPRRLYRDPNNRILAGVAAGIAEHLRVPVVAVRIGFVLMLTVNGLGGLLYAAFWAVLPTAPGVGKRRRQPRQMLSFVALVAGVVLMQIQFGWFGLDATLVALVALIAIGVGVIWHQADPERRRRITEAMPDVPLVSVLRRNGEAEGDRRWFLLRLVGGGLLVITGIIGILAVFAPPGSERLSPALMGLLFALLALAGVVLALAPLLMRIFGQLREERVARIREQERAELAAMVHDQVLHTLALIQRNAGDVKTIQRLARGQERSLRNWLYKPTGSPTERFAAALEQAAAEVEDTYAIAVEVVVVGDEENDDRVAALVAASREALVNAARHAKVTTISLYAEVEEEQLSVYVRDRGAGFDLSTVEDDRHGVRGSIIGRMQRHGGRAEIRTAPGEGTEVALTMPRGQGTKGERT